MEFISIKRINADEADFVINLFNQYRIFYKQKTDMALAEGFIQERLTKKESVIFVALVKEGDKTIPIGFTQLYPLYSSVRAVKNWILNDLYVETGYRKKGIGEKLIRTAMQFAKENNSTSIQLETANDNYNAQKLYESIGFKKCNPHQGSIVYQIEIESVQ